MSELIRIPSLPCPGRRIFRYDGCWCRKRKIEVHVGLCVRPPILRCSERPLTRKRAIQMARQAKDARDFDIMGWHLWLIINPNRFETTASSCSSCAASLFAVQIDSRAK